MTNDSRADDLLKAAGAVGALIPRAASVAVGISFVSYFTGWREANAYFTALGSPWAVSLLPASRLLYMSGELVMGVLLCAFLAVHYVTTGDIGPKGLARCSLGAFALAAGLIGFAYWLPNTFVAPKVVWWLSTSAGLCFAVGSGATLGGVVSGLKDNELRWTASHAFSIYIAVFAGLYSMPAQIGAAKAKYQLESLEATLPAVRLATSIPSENWRLVEVIGDSALLIDRQRVTTEPLLRLVKATDILSINSMETKAVK